MLLLLDTLMPRTAIHGLVHEGVQRPLNLLHRIFRCLDRVNAMQEVHEPVILPDGHQDGTRSAVPGDDDHPVLVPGLVESLADRARKVRTVDQHRLAVKVMPCTVLAVTCMTFTAN